MYDKTRSSSRPSRFKLQKFGVLSNTTISDLISLSKGKNYGYNYLPKQYVYSEPQTKEWRYSLFCVLNYFV